MNTLDFETLKKAYDNGIIDMNTIRMQSEDMDREKCLKMHKFKVWFGEDDNWHTYLPDKEKGRVHKKRRNKEDLEKLIIEFYQETGQNPTIEEVFYEWIERRVRLGQIAYATKDRTEDFFRRHFEEMGKRRIKTVTVKEWANFLEEQVAKKELTSKAYSGLKNVVFGLLKRAKVRGLIDFRISEINEYIDLGKNSFRKAKNHDKKEVFDEEETELIIKYLLMNPDKHNVALLLMFVTGMRIGEVAILKNEDIRENYIIISDSESRYRNGHGNSYDGNLAKTEKSERIVVLPEGCEWICKRLKLLNPDGEYVFVNKKGRMTTNCFRRRLERICKKLQITPKSPHKIRKTYASILLDENFDNCLVTDQLGHVDIDVTEENYHRNRKKIEKKAEKLGKIEEFNLIKGAG